jgi:predicted enzyme related to lactoylglutathione lyase
MQQTLVYGEVNQARETPMNRAFTSILTETVEETAQFYQTLLGMKRAGEFGWFIVLSHDALPGFELGILDRHHETIPAEVAARPGGAILTFVVENLEAMHGKAIAMKAEIVQDPKDLSYGQRRLLLRDPAGTIIDVSSPVR